MRFNNLDLNLLVALDALLTEQSVSRAAQRINLSQSAMSAALGRLREYFGDELFVTVGRVTRPTAFAQDLAAPIRRILTDIQGSVIFRQPFDPRTSRRSFAVAASDYMVRVYLVEFARALQNLAPNVQLDLWPVTGSNTIAKFTAGEIDILFTLKDLLLPDLPIVGLATEDFVVVAWSENDAIGETLTLENFETLGHVTVRLGIYRATPIDESFVSNAGVRRRCEITVSAFDQIPDFIVGTQRIAMLQRRLAEKYATVLPLRILELPFSMPQVAIGMQWHHHSTSDAAHIWLRETFIDWHRRLEDERGSQRAQA
ncbi:LysR family transcriptional regulator [Rhizobium sp. P38BS-XIX]|uniref:LysR family transcriptional regulator n=1 Tax=Rhizobium sp. P38BS-XIX TaxID=2726740 RepID=UPI0014578102|nr:LysR family transcriptional regulator [Rhizobium sp. P38BS-XIX]NLR97368.1 LysR family transcriptional regulator [Rhizobium sp. P38BS-XIX]